MEVVTACRKAGRAPLPGVSCSGGAMEPPGSSAPEEPVGDAETNECACNGAGRETAWDSYRGTWSEGGGGWRHEGSKGERVEGEASWAGPGAGEIVGGPVPPPGSEGGHVRSSRGIEGPGERGHGRREGHVATSARPPAGPPAEVSEYSVTIPLDLAAAALAGIAKAAPGYPCGDRSDGSELDDGDCAAWRALEAALKVPPDHWAAVHRRCVGPPVSLL